MKKKVINNEELEQKVAYARANKFISNCYSKEVIREATSVWKEKNSFIFSYLDHTINRLIFFVEEWEDINILTNKIEEGIFYMEIMTKNPDEYIPKGMNGVVKMLRFANPDINSIFKNDNPNLQYMNPQYGEIATVERTEEINKLLWSSFHTEISHLLYDDELKTKIEEGMVSIHKNEYDEIDALLQIDVKPRKYYINQVLNLAEPKIINSILLNSLKKYADAGGKYVYSWIEDSNIASIKFHSKYGMKHDGMYNVVYRLEKRNV